VLEDKNQYGDVPEKDSLRDLAEPRERSRAEESLRNGSEAVVEKRGQDKQCSHDQEKQMFSQPLQARIAVRKATGMAWARQVEGGARQHVDTQGESPSEGWGQANEPCPSRHEVSPHAHEREGEPEREPCERPGKGVGKNAYEPEMLGRRAQRNRGSRETAEETQLDLDGPESAASECACSDPRIDRQEDVEGALRAQTPSGRNPQVESVHIVDLQETEIDPPMAPSTPTRAPGMSKSTASANQYAGMILKARLRK